MRHRWTCSPPLSVNLSHFSVGVFSLWPGFLFGVAVCLCLKNVLVVLKNFPISTWSALQFLGMWLVFFVSCCVKDSHQNADWTVLLLTNASRPLNVWHSLFFYSFVMMIKFISSFLFVSLWLCRPLIDNNRQHIWTNFTLILDISFSPIKLREYNWWSFYTVPYLYPHLTSSSGDHECHDDRDRPTWLTIKHQRTININFYIHSCYWSSKTSLIISDWCSSTTKIMTGFCLK